MTTDQLKSLTGIHNDAIIGEIASNLNILFDRYRVNTGQRKRHLLAQMFTESWGLKSVEENLHYPAKRLMEVFPKYFTGDMVLDYAMNPQKIASRVYANKFGNGNEASGDGYRYRGRGYIQITFRSNYALLQNDCPELSCLDDPDALTTIKGAALSAFWFWNKHNLNAIADTSGDDVTRCREVVNGGKTDLALCQSWYNKLKEFEL